MDLTNFERLSLINQFKILEKLYPEEQRYYSNHRQALEEGYKLHYNWIFEHMWDEMSEDECKEVVNILDMYRAITFSAEKLKDIKNIQEHYWLQFRGFDGNNETSQMAYCRYFIKELDRFGELTYGKEYADFNSHMPSLPKYQKMLQVWNSLDEKHDLNQETLLKVLEA